MQRYAKKPIKIKSVYSYGGFGFGHDFDSVLEFDIPDERSCNTVGCSHVGMDGPAQAILAVLFGDKCPKALKYRHAGSKRPVF